MRRQSTARMSSNDTVPPSHRPMLAPFTPSILVKAYKGKRGEAASQFRADSIEMAAGGYFPKWQSWAPGEWPKKAYVVAGLLMLFFGMGILVLAYLLNVEPDGTFTV